MIKMKHTTELEWHKTTKEKPKVASSPGENDVLGYYNSGSGIIHIVYYVKMTESWRCGWDDTEAPDYWAKCNPEDLLPMSILLRDEDF